MSEPVFDVREEQLAPHFLKHHVNLGDGNYVIHHTFSMPDLSDPHDHPWPFTSMVTKGSYVEEIFTIDPTAPEGHRVERVTRRKGDHFDVPADRIHRIVELPEGECCTVVLYGEPCMKVGLWRWENGQTLHRFHDEAEFRPIAVEG